MAIALSAERPRIVHRAIIFLGWAPDLFEFVLWDTNEASDCDLIDRASIGGRGFMRSSDVKGQTPKQSFALFSSEASGILTKDGSGRSLEWLRRSHK